MALAQYRIESFHGLNQGWSENTLENGNSPDACNMETGDGDLSVAKGYVHHLDIPLPQDAAHARLYVWNRTDGRRFIAAATQKVYALLEGDAQWTCIHTYTAAQEHAGQYDFLVLKIAGAEALLIASGRAQMIRWDGDTANAATLFGSAAQGSDVPVNFIELYYNRLFAAGDPDNPCRLYWSMAPGDARSIADWGVDEASENVSGGFVEVGADSDPITGLFALSNQLLIFKRDSVYRLLGDRPGNYRIVPLNAAMRQPVHTAVCRYGDVLFFLTDGGMYYYDGQTVRRQADANQAQYFLKSADLTECTCAACRDRLYFAVKEHAESGDNDAVLVYDLARGTYMVRRGFTVSDLFAVGGALYLLDGERYVCRFNEGNDYAGRAIEAYWVTPMTDMQQKLGNKQLRELYLRGTGGRIAVEAETDSARCYYEHMMPREETGILEVPLTGDGRAFRLRFQNVCGSAFSIRGGVELLLDIQRRTL